MSNPRWAGLDRNSSSFGEVGSSGGVEYSRSSGVLARPATKTSIVQHLLGGVAEAHQDIPSLEPLPISDEASRPFRLIHRSILEAGTTCLPSLKVVSLPSRSLRPFMIRTMASI